MDLKELLSKNEDMHFEFKGEMPRDVTKHLIAFSNSEGGTIIFGVADNKNIYGVDDINKLTAQLYSCANSIYPSVKIDISTIFEDNKEILIVTIPKGEFGVYSINGQYYIRRRGSSVPLVSRDELLSLMIERGQTSYGIMPSVVKESAFSKVSFSDNKIKEFIKRAKDYRNLEGISGLELKDLLRKIKCLTTYMGREVPTNAGLLFFCDNPQEVLPHTMIKIVRFKGNDTSIPIDKVNLKGTLPELIESSISFIKRNTATKPFFKGVRMIEKTEYPILSLREAITNAVAHRDYAIQQQTVRIFIFDDRIEIMSPGGLPPPINLQNITTGQYSREPLICKLLFQLGYMEELGSGVGRMIKIIKDWGLKEPYLKDDGSDFTVTFYNEQIGEDKSEFLNGSLIREKNLTGLSEPQIIALKFVTKENTINKKQYMDLTKTSSSTATRQLSNLVKRGLLKEMGSGKNTYYVLNNE